MFTAKNGSIIFYTEEDGFSNNVSSVATQFPNASSNGAFWGEEFQVIVKYKGERDPNWVLSTDGNPRIKITLIDQDGVGIRSSFTGQGAAPNLDMDYFVTDPNPLAEPPGLVPISYTHGLVDDYTGVDNSVEISNGNYDGGLSIQFNEALGGDYGDVSSHEVVSLGRISNLNGVAEWPAFGGDEDNANTVTNAMCGTSGISSSTKRYTKSKSVAVTFRVAPSPAIIGQVVTKIGFKIEVTGCLPSGKTGLWFEDVSINRIRKLQAPGYAGVALVTNTVPAHPD